MKATELRIGNIVNYKINDEIDKRKEWNEENIIDALDLVAITQCEIAKRQSDYIPIPLTEKWLSRFSFNYNDLNGDSGHWQIKSPISIFEILQGEDGFFYEYATEIKYVHELQDLYYALTKQELVLAVTPINTNANGA